MATLIRHDGTEIEPPGLSNNEKHRDSRMLSKKQLSDMAYGIRELSKNLAHMKLKLKVQNVFILGKAHDNLVVEHTRELVVWLLDSDKSNRV
jgi:NAD+ kinase